MRRRILGLVLCGLVLYGAAPAVVDVLGGWRDLDRVTPGWWLAVILAQVAGWVCLWALQRLALQRARWFPVVTSQPASGARGRVGPRGAAATPAPHDPVPSQAGARRPAVPDAVAGGPRADAGRDRADRRIAPAARRARGDARSRDPGAHRRAADPDGAARGRRAGARRVRVPVRPLRAADGQRPGHQLGGARGRNRAASPSPPQAGARRPARAADGRARPRPPHPGPAVARG